MTSTVGIYADIYIRVLYMDRCQLMIEHTNNTHTQTSTSVGTVCTHSSMYTIVCVYVCTNDKLSGMCCTVFAEPLAIHSDTSVI